jgi:serine/threonine protein kinase
VLRDAEGLLGRTIEDYQLIRVLGRGGMSMVLLGQSLHDAHVQVAIKVLKPSLSSMVDDYASFQARFRREAKTIHHLHQEHIVPVLSYGETEDLVYMVMPVIDGGTLASRLALHDEPVPFPEIERYLSQLASALDFAHHHGIVHRDIKPSNVLLDKQGNIYLADFGIARLFDPALADLQTGPTSLTILGEIFGTPAYIAPERFVGEQAGPPADIYALGIVLYLLVTGQVPFEAETPLVLGMKHVNEPPRSPRALRPDLPEPAEAAILRALAKQPADRFASAGALAQAFEAGLEGAWTPGSGLPDLALERTPAPPLPSGQAAQSDVDALPVGPGNSRPLFLATPHSERRRWALLAGLLATGVVLLSLLIALLLNGQRAALPGSLSSFPIFPTQSTGQTPAPTRTRGTVQPSSGQHTPDVPGGTTVSVNKQTVFAVQNSDGALLWRHTVDGQIVSPPVNTGGVIYVVTVSGTVYAFQESNGQVLWSNDIGNPVNAPLAVTNGVVYVRTSNGSPYELNAETGQLLTTIVLTPGITPIASPGVTPTPTVMPTSGKTPTPTSGVTPTPSPAETPTPTPEVTPTPTSGVTPTPGTTPGRDGGSRHRSRVGDTPTPISEVTPTPGDRPRPTPGHDGGSRHRSRTGDRPRPTPTLVATKTPLQTPEESPTSTGTPSGKQV